MRAVAQRVSEAAVRVDGEVVGAITEGLLIYLGAGRGDGEAEVAYLANKIAGLRVFRDDEGKMSRSVEDVGGAVLVVSQFTLFGDVRKGRRPSFTGAEAPERANELYEAVCDQLAGRGIPVQKGRFRAMMDVSAVVDGPITILIDSEKTF